MIFKNDLLKVIKHSDIVSLHYGTLATNFVLQIILLKFINSNSFGIYVIASSIKDIILTVISLNLGTAFIQRKGDETQLFATAFWLSAANFVFIICVLTGSYFILKLTSFYDINIINIFLILGMVSAFQSMSSIVYSRLEKEERFNVNSVLNLGVSIFVGMITLILAYSGYQIYALVIRDITTTFISFSIYSIILFKNYGVESVSYSYVSKDYARSLLTYSYKTILARISETIFYRLDILILGKIFDKGTVGLYDRAKYFAAFSQTFIGTLAQRVLFVKYAKNDLISAESLFLRMTKFIFAASILLYSVFYVFLYLMTNYFMKDWSLITQYYLYFLLFSCIYPVSENLKIYFFSRDNIYKSIFLLRIMPIIMLIATGLIYYLFPLKAVYMALFFSLSISLPSVMAIYRELHNK
jgi:O-antigen/teichoic acid export membrane protein